MMLRRVVVCCAFAVAGSVYSEKVRGELQRKVVSEFQLLFSQSGGSRAADGLCASGESLRTPELGLCCNGACEAVCAGECGAFDREGGSGRGVSAFEACCALLVVERGLACGEAKTGPCYVSTRGASSSSTATAPSSLQEVHVAIAAGGRHGIGLVAAARSVVDASGDPTRLRLHLVTDAAPGSPGWDVLWGALDCTLRGSAAAWELKRIDKRFVADHSSVVAAVLDHTRVGGPPMTVTAQRLRSAPVNYARFFLEELFPSLAGARVAYLDPDVLVNDDVARLVDAAFAPNQRSVLEANERKYPREPTTPDRPPPAVAATKKNSRNRIMDDLYASRGGRAPRRISEFNAGVAVYDLARWKAQKLTQAAEEWMRYSLEANANASLSDHPTQTPMTLAVASNYFALSPTWNCPIHTGHGRDEALHTADECLQHVAVRHFTGTRKPWYPFGRLRFLWLPVVHPRRHCLPAIANLTRSAPVQ